MFPFRVIIPNIQEHFFNQQTFRHHPQKKYNIFIHGLVVSNKYYGLCLSIPLLPQCVQIFPLPLSRKKYKQSGTAGVNRSAQSHVTDWK